MPLDFNELVQKLDDDETKSLHQELVSRNLYNNLVDLSDIGDDLNRIKNIIPIALQRLNYEDIRQIAPETIKQAISTFIDAETKTTEIPEPPDEQLPGQAIVESKAQEIDKIKIRIGEITAERGRNGRILPEHKDEVNELITKLKKVYKLQINDIVDLTNIPSSTVSRNIREFLNKHPFEEHRWLAAAEKKAIVKADETLTKAAGKTANELVETYLSLGQWAMEAYTLMALTLGMSVRELVELGVDSYDPALHIEMLEMQREKDELNTILHQSNSYINSQNQRIQELEGLLLGVMVMQNPDAPNIINI